MLIDIIALTLIAFGFFRGFNRGFVKSLASFFSIFIGVVLAMNFSYVAAQLLDQWFNLDPKVLPLISFIAVFVFVLLVLQVIANVVDKILGVLMLGFFNKIAGGFLYAFVFSFILSTLIWFVDSAGIIAQELKDQSLTYTWIEPIAPATIQILEQWIPGLGNVFDSFDELIKNIKATKDKLPI